jgi:hypothetical protein
MLYEVICIKNIIKIKYFFIFKNKIDIYNIKKYR